MTELRDLLEDLRQGARPALSVDDVELLLGWLTGSAARDDEHGDALPRPGNDPVLLQMVLHRLDDVLFDAGELRPAAAGLDPSEPATRRRIRFRRLVSAFHPDRFPDLADWLTQRSQAVHRAYARFKQDPDAPAVAPAPHRSQPARSRQDMRRGPPRARKHRFRAFAEQLRARFGNDPYLAHKLIGGLAVLALLPVLNMVLVPGKDTVDAVRFTDVGEEERPVSGFRVPVSGERRDGASVDAGEDSAGAVSGRDRSAPETPPTKGDSSAQDAPPTTSEPASQLAGQPANQPTGKPGAAVGAGSSRDKSAPETPPTEQTTNNQQLAGGQQATTGQQENRPTGQPANPPTSQPDTGVGAGPAGADSGPAVESLAGQAPTPEDGSDTAEDSDPAREPSTAVGAGSSRDDRGPESRIASNQSEIADPDAPARKPETGNRNPSPSATNPEMTPLLAAARRAMNPNGEIATVAALQTVDEQLAAMGLENDTERLYRRIGEEEEKTVSGFRVPVSGEKRDGASVDAGEDSVGAVSGRDRSAPETPPTKGDPSAQDAPPTTNEPASQLTGQPANPPTSQPDTGVGAGPAGDDSGPGVESLAGQAPTPVANAEAPADFVGAGSSRDDRGPETRIAATQSDAAEPGAPARKPETGNPKPAPEAQPDSELVLGPLGRHPAGEVLQRFHAAMQAGNIAGIAGSFAPDARMASLRGRDEIADHFRAELDSADSRQVQLKVLRLGREDDGWRVEADLDVRVRRDASTRALVTGRSSFWLGGRGDRMLITRMERE